MTTILDNYKSHKSWVFRGQSKETWELLPKAGRKEYWNKFNQSFSEKDFFSSWCRYASHFINKEPQDDWEWLALAQHHGLATRLMDWTKNPLSAFFFACNQYENEDGAVFCFRIKKTHKLSLLEDPFSIRKFGVFFPRGSTPRILSQRGLFTISEEPSNDLASLISNSLTKIIIPNNIKSDILQSLDFYGINELSVYQDLDHLNRYIKSTNDPQSISSKEC